VGSAEELKNLLRGQHELVDNGGQGYGDGGDGLLAPHEVVCAGCFRDLIWGLLVLKSTTCFHGLVTDAVQIEFDLRPLNYWSSRGLPD
jgi:hypothetical protein